MGSLTQIHRSLSVPPQAGLSLEAKPGGTGWGCPSLPALVIVLPSFTPNNEEQANFAQDQAVAVSELQASSAHRITDAPSPGCQLRCQLTVGVAHTHCICVSTES